jgi:site-specific recombinase XerD
MTMPIEVRTTGPLAPHAEGFYAELMTLGYTPLSAIMQLRLLAHLSRWLARHRLGLIELTQERMDQFLRARKRVGYTAWLSRRALAPLLAYLRGVGVAPQQPPMTPNAVEKLVAHYRDHLIRERGLAAKSVQLYEPLAMRFLSERFPAGKPKLAQLTAADITRFVLHECQGRALSHCRLVVSALRSLLRFFHVRGWIEAPLAAAVPTVASWRLASLPRPIEPECVVRVLHSCDRRTASGRRAYAIILLLARLGLRASEVCALRLEDVDWRSGELLVRGKGNRQEKLPLPLDVGEALAAYLRRDRPQVADRAFFFRRFAPIRALTRAAVRHVVGMACVRAGLAPFGAHRLRHTAATEMLRGGASLSVIGQVLRHRSIESTALYAKVDRRALRTLAQPWPGA